MFSNELHDTRVPVLLITGFLGSGKTTFINWILKERPNDNISIILNEYGSIQLESQFLETRPFGVVSELANGCMCCVAKDDIPRVIEYILEKAPHTSQIIIEASGLSDPDPVALALQEGRLIESIRLDTIVAIIDAVNFEDHKKKFPIVMSQVADADLLVLSKATEISKDQETTLVDHLRSIGLNTKVLVGMINYLLSFLWRWIQLLEHLMTRLCEKATTITTTTITTIIFMIK